MAKTAEKHIHKFKRLTYKSGNTVFFCVDADCNKKLNTSLALGKRSICWRCGEPFILTEYSLRLAKPHCDSCHKPKNDSRKEFLPDLKSMEEHVTNLNGPLTLAERLQMAVKPAQPEEDEL
jgi:hypothetical protein